MKRNAGAGGAARCEPAAPWPSKRPRRGLRWVRRLGDIEHVVGLRRSRTGNGTAVWFQAERHATPLGDPLELSPVAPLSNTWWWPSPLEGSDADVLRSQLQQIVLPYFAALPLDRAAVEQALATALSPLEDTHPGVRSRRAGALAPARWRESISS